MNYEELQKANATIKKVDIKGKAYAEVNERIRVFRMLYPEGRISTEMLSNDNGVCVFKAVITDGDGHILGTGHSYEKEGNGFINATSYIENCETSAVGRALGMCGIGIDTSVASYEEVGNAIKQQEGKKKTEPATKEQRQEFINYVTEAGADLTDLCQRYKITQKSSYEDLKQVMKIVSAVNNR